MASFLIWYDQEPLIDLCLNHKIAPPQRFLDDVERHVDETLFSLEGDHLGALIEHLDKRHRIDFYRVLGKLELIDPIANQIGVSAQGLHQSHARLRARLKPFV